jgi:predicted nucleotidyltransferase
MPKMLDYLSIFKELIKKGVKFIVVGGIAVNLYGIPRMTYDIDLLLDLDDENLENFLRLLKEWGFKPKVPVDIMDFARRKMREDWIRNKNMKAFNLVNPKWAVSEIDIIINTPVAYNEASKRVNYIPLHDISIPLISIDDLIKMKQNTGRQQDKADIRYLRELKSEKK